MRLLTFELYLLLSAYYVGYVLHLLDLNPYLFFYLQASIAYLDVMLCNMCYLIIWNTGLL